jgi:type 1 glutamine amidotransferase
MRSLNLKAVWITLFVVLAFAASEAAARQMVFRSIFDGKSLNGWKAPEMSYWSVQDGAITARSTQQHPVTENQFLVWQLGRLDDFELTLKYRISGTPAANSGVQIRSRVEADGHAVGYQADIDLAGRYAGALYEERGRGMLAERGQKTVIGSDGKMTHTPLGDPQALFNSIKKDDWNDYDIVARGNHIVLKINGRVTAEVFDNDKSHRALSGVLALQLHAGPPTTVQFKDIRLKRLELDGRKKVVFVAGRRSHGYGAHEHKAGCLLLAKRLNESVPQVYAIVYTNGWPKDPTALDNADEVVFYCDGGEGHVVMPHLEEMNKLADDGVGIACLHYAVEVPKGKPGDDMLHWIGGYFETFWSVNPHYKADFKELPRHPITRGVKPFAIEDEWYYHMRFAKNMQGVTPILTCIPPDSAHRKGNDAHGANPYVRARMGMPEHVAWAFERPGGGRGFGFTGGHWHYNWANDDFRKIVLNALVWVAGLDVPPGGVPSKTPSIEELKANQDYPMPRSYDWERIEQMIKQWNRP